MDDYARTVNGSLRPVKLTMEGKPTALEHLCARLLSMAQTDDPYRSYRYEGTCSEGHANNLIWRHHPIPGEPEAPLVRQAFCSGCRESMNLHQVPCDGLGNPI